MSTGEIPKVEYLKSFTASNAGQCADTLEYDRLYKDTSRNARLEGQRIDAFLEQEPGSIEELGKARQLAFAYWVATADKVIDSGAHNRDLWAQRYTNASVELFGAPEYSAAVREIAQQKTTFDSMLGNDAVDQTQLSVLIDAYEPILETAQLTTIQETDRNLEADFETAIAACRWFIESRFGYILELVDSSDKATYTQPELVELFTQALGSLVELDDEAWREWKVVTPEKGSAISVHGQNREVIIPMKRESADRTEAKKLLGHELLTHALRAKNGRKSTEEKMLKGFPNYLDGEEGLAILMGAAASDGKVSDVTHDRYIDIALATGVVGEIPKKRHEIFDIMFARRVVRAQQSGEPVDEAKIRKSTSVYVDRIFRGSPGDDIGTHQAVYTADIYYYNYNKIAGFIAHHIREGQTTETIFDYLMQGKFNPLDPLHRQRVGELSQQ